MSKPTQAQIEAALKDMLTFFGKPRRDEWMNEQAWKEAKQVCANAEAALTAAAEVGEIDAVVLAKIAAKEKEKRDLAVAEMKERCAQVAEWKCYATVGRQIAAEIRALAVKP